MTSKKTLLIDLDGVLNEYSGNYQENYIPPMREGVESFLETLSKDFELKLFTTRSQKLAQDWTEKNEIEHFFSEITNYKSPAWLQLDDRCLTFNGDYADTITQIKSFTPWYKQSS